MKIGKIGRKVTGLSLFLMLLITTAGALAGGSSSETTLEITDIRGGLGSVIVDVTNTGDVTAEKLSIITAVTGGIFNQIDIYHRCSGCDMCGTTLEPNMTKTETTSEAGVIFGVGPIEINVSASASNADEVTQTTNGFVLGPIVII